MTQYTRNRRIEGTFSWRRQQLLVHIGGTLTFEVPVPLAFNGIPVVSLTRDHAGCLLTSINMLTASIMPRLRMFENDWISVGTPVDLEAPPFGRKLSARYSNGDRLRLEFITVDDPDALAECLPRMDRARLWASSLMHERKAGVPALTFPAVLADIEFELPDAGISITSQGVRTPMLEASGHYVACAPCAVNLGTPAPIPTVLNSIGISREKPNLRFASMNDQELWSISGRNFSGMGFLLDGHEFEGCNFDQCWFSMRGQRFALKHNTFSPMTLMPSPEIQAAYDVIEALTGAGIPPFVAAAERLAKAAADGRTQNPNAS
ncbi:MAG: hypothetical protein NTZ56_13815 [Acidobacteria bacterium]|nr:hypothetical protein [Acidobacteriota bacterium]